MSSTGRTVRPLHPVFFCPMQVQEVGIIGVMIMMSSDHFGLIVCMHDSPIEASDQQCLIDDVVMPLLDLMPQFVHTYRTRNQVLGDYAPLETNCLYTMKVLSEDEVVFRLSPGTLPAGTEDSVWYLYVAPSGVHFEEFMAMQSRLLS